MAIRSAPKEAHGTDQWLLRSLLLIDLDAAGAEIDMDALRLLAVLVEIIAQHGGDHGERADQEIEHVAVGRHWGSVGLGTLGVSRSGSRGTRAG